MPVLLVQSCSASKRQCSAPVPALELYNGYFYKIIHKSRREGVLRNDIVLRILSAEHGILHPDSEVSYYDRRMTPDRARELRVDVLKSLSDTVVAEEIDTVVVNAGTDYRPALSGLEEKLDEVVDVKYITGRGNGEMGSQLKSFIRSDEHAELQVNS